MIGREMIPVAERSGRCAEADAPAAGRNRAGK